MQRMQAPQQFWEWITSSFLGDQLGVLETLRVPEPPLPLVAFLGGGRWIGELIDLLSCEVDGL
jgi:hypothetical protein